MRLRALPGNEAMPRSHELPCALKRLHFARDARRPQVSIAELYRASDVLACTACLGRTESSLSARYGCPAREPFLAAREMRPGPVRANQRPSCLAERLRPAVRVTGPAGPEDLPVIPFVVRSLF
jgi:hypothetical protein